MRLALAILVSLLWLPRASAKDLSIEVARDSFSHSETNRFQAAAEELAKKTGDLVVLHFTDGGEDAAVVARLAAGTIDGCVLNAAGLRLLLPDARVFDLPLLFDDAAALDAGRATVEADLDQILAGGGYVNLGWTDDGPVRLFSQAEIKTLTDLQLTFMGVAAGDSLMKSYLTHLGVNAVPFASDSATMGMADKGTIDALHATPLVGTQALLGYVSKTPTAWTTGAFIVRADVFSALDAADQAALRDMARDATANQRRSARATKIRVSRNNRDSNVVETVVPKALLDEWRIAAEKTWIEHAGKLYDVVLLNKILTAQGKQGLDASRLPARVVTIKAATATKAAATAVTYRGDGIEDALTVALAEAPEDLRALRLAFEDCDAGMMTEWIRFPLRVGGASYPNAGELSKACTTGDLPQLPAAELEAGVRNPSLSGTDLRLRIGDRDWRFVWSGRQWWLTEVAASL